MSSPDYTLVELPFIEQLQQMGWDYLEGDTGVPYLTERENFRQVLLTDRLREAIARINLDEDGEPWLDEARINQGVSRLDARQCQSDAWTAYHRARCEGHRTGGYADPADRW